MNIITRQVPGKPLTVTIEYSEYTEAVRGLVKRIESFDIGFRVFMDEHQMRIALADVYYLENVERKMFLYTMKDVFRLDASMQEIGKVTEDSDLVRISRTCIMNISHLTEVKQLKNSHLEAKLDNGERLIVSRKYLHDIKRRF